MNNDLIPVRVLCSWSKTTNLTYITLADTRPLDINAGMKHKIIGMLTTKFEECQAFHDGKFIMFFFSNNFSSKSSRLPNNFQIFPLKNYERNYQENTQELPKDKIPWSRDTNRLTNQNSHFRYKIRFQRSF